MIEVGKRYLFIVAFGWGFVGRVESLHGLNEVVLSDCHFITNCGQDTDWGRFVRKGPNSGAIVNKLGETVINLDHCIWRTEFVHQLPQSR